MNRYNLNYTKIPARWDKGNTSTLAGCRFPGSLMTGNTPAAPATPTPKITQNLIKKAAPTLPVTPEVEAKEFMGHKLTPVSQQNIDARKVVRYINKNTFRLKVGGLVDHPLSLSYADLQALPQISRLTDSKLVEDWNFTAKWSGPSLSSILREAGIKPEAKIVIFHTEDAPLGSSSLDLSYIFNTNIIIALKDNDISLTPAGGFPCRVIAMINNGYKWAKWVTEIEVSDRATFQGNIICHCDLDDFWPYGWPGPWPNPWPW